MEHCVEAATEKACLCGRRLEISGSLSAWIDQRARRCDAPPDSVCRHAPIVALSFCFFPCEVVLRNAAEG